MPPLIVAKPSLSDLRSIEGFLDDVLQRQSLLLARMEVLEQTWQDASTTTNTAVPGTSAALSPSPKSVTGNARWVTLPLFTPDSENDDDDEERFYSTGKAN